jgi:hypothetical protein
MKGITPSALNRPCGRITGPNYLSGFPLKYPVQSAPADLRVIGHGAAQGFDRQRKGEDYEELQ